VTVAFPATPLLLARARICISASHTREDLIKALEVKLTNPFYLISREITNRHFNLKFQPFRSNYRSSAKSVILLASSTSPLNLTRPMLKKTGRSWSKKLLSSLEIHSEMKQLASQYMYAFRSNPRPFLLELLFIHHKCKLVYFLAELRFIFLPQSFSFVQLQ